MSYTILCEMLKPQIYCDMDGVLTDFNKAFKDLGHGPIEQFEKRYGTVSTWKVINKQGLSFWTEMEWMPDGKTLWKHIKKYNPTILTAPADSKVCKVGKLQWVKHKLGLNIPVILERDKYKYANADSILIDDTAKKYKPWREHGGIAIAHINAKTTIQQLERILK